MSAGTLRLLSSATPQTGYTLHRYSLDGSVTHCHNTAQREAQDADLVPQSNTAVGRVRFQGSQ